jgi:hypothetical protein
LGDQLMTIRLAVLTACGLLALTPAANAQSAGEQNSRQELHEELSEGLAQLLERLRPLALDVGMDFADLSARLNPLLRAAIPFQTPGEGDWAFDMDFSHKVFSDDDGAQAEGRKTVFNDAQACIAASPSGGAIVHFRRIATGALNGHQCVTASVSGATWVLLSNTYAESPDRHLIAEYSATATIEDDAAAVQAWAGSVTDANIALAVAMADLAVEAGLKAEAKQAN